MTAIRPHQIGIATALCALALGAAAGGAAEKRAAPSAADSHDEATNNANLKALVAAVAANQGPARAKAKAESHAPTKEAAHAVAEKDAPAPAAHGVHWGYDGTEGPVHWGHLSPDYALCSAGRMQSPVDLAFANASAAFTVTPDYKRGPLNIVNNGHTIQVNFDTGSQITSSGHRYGLLQVHFHTPSENMLNGKHYPLEAHFVHRDETGQLAVLGVFFEEGATNNELAKIVVAAPNVAGEPHAVEGFELDPALLLPADLRVFRFMGSLTTPPCTEGVNWHIARQTATASASQIAALSRLMGENARPVQPLNNRLLIAPE